MLKLKFQYFGHLMWRADSLEKILMLGRLKVGGEGDNRGWDGWMASLTQWTWVWTNSGEQWRTRKSGVLQSMVYPSHLHLCCSVVSDSLWPHELQRACQASLFITNSQSLLKLMSIELVMPSNHLILWHLLLLPPSIFPNIRVFSKESVLHIRRPKYWNFSFSISPSNEYSGLISFRIDWFDLFAVSPRDS